MNRPSKLARLGGAISQFFNVIVFDGDENYSISTDAYRLGRNRLRRFVDRLFAPWERDHCRASYERDLAKASALQAEEMESGR